MAFAPVIRNYKADCVFAVFSLYIINCTYIVCYFIHYTSKQYIVQYLWSLFLFSHIFCQLLPKKVDILFLHHFHTIINIYLSAIKLHFSNCLFFIACYPITFFYIFIRFFSVLDVFVCVLGVYFSLLRK